MKNPILLYIDPSTGSMLFAILIGIIGALTYMVKTWFVKIRFILTSGKVVADTNKYPLVIFVDDKRYWNVFEPVIKELSSRQIPVTYMTASKDDPGLKCTYEKFAAEFIGEGNRAFAKLNFLSASIVLSTTPGLDVYQWKKSKDVDYYLHMLHACDGVTAYRMFGLDYYDGVMLSGQYQEDDLRNLEKLRNLPAKETCLVGIPYMDKMATRLKEAGPIKEHPRTVLLAPSWGPSSILNKYGESFITELVKTGYTIIIRPHPQSFTSEKEMIDSLMAKFPETDKLSWNRDNDNFDVLRKADILISDFSAVTYDFALVYDKPIIYADTEFDKGPYDAWWLDTPYWTFTALERIGMKLTRDKLSSIKEMIDECIEDERFAKGRDEVRGETWVYPSEGASRAADFIEKKLSELCKTADKQNPEAIKDNIEEKEGE